MTTETLRFALGGVAGEQREVGVGGGAGIDHGDHDPFARDAVGVPGGRAGKFFGDVS